MNSGTRVNVTGKATVDGKGNCHYIVMGIDNGTGGDQYGQQVTDANSNVVQDPSHAPVDASDGAIFVGK